jgi:hypothetical protein
MEAFETPYLHPMLFEKNMRMVYFLLLLKKSGRCHILIFDLNSSNLRSITQFVEAWLKDLCSFAHRRLVQSKQLSSHLHRKKLRSSTMGSECYCAPWNSTYQSAWNADSKSTVQG